MKNEIVSNYSRQDGLGEHDYKWLEGKGKPKTVGVD